MPTSALQVPEPDLVRVRRTATTGWVEGPSSGIRVTTDPTGLGRTVVVEADSGEGGAVSRVHLR